MSHEVQLSAEGVLPTVVYNAFEWSCRESIDGQLKDRTSRASPLHPLVFADHWSQQRTRRLVRFVATHSMSMRDSSSRKPSPRIRELAETNGAAGVAIKSLCS